MRGVRAVAVTIAITAMLPQACALAPQRSDDRVTRALVEHGIRDARVVGPISAGGLTGYMFERPDGTGGYVAFGEDGELREFGTDDHGIPGQRVIRIGAGTTAVNDVTTVHTGWLIGELDDPSITRVVISSGAARQEAAVTAPIFLVKLNQDFEPGVPATWTFYDAAGNKRREGGG